MKMLIRAFLALSLLASGAASAAISGTKVYGTSGTVGNGGWPATIDLTGHTPTAGNILVVCQMNNDDAPGSSATTPSGFTAGPTYSDGSAGALSGAIFWKKAGGAESSISVTWSDTTYGGSYVYVELPGTDLDVDALGDSGENEANIASATTSLSSGSASNSTATGLAIACLSTDNLTNNDVTGWSNSFNEQQETDYGSTARGETFLATKVLSSAAAQSTAGTITSDQGYGSILVFNASGSTCPATCVDGPSGPRSARCITDISDASDADNILYGLSPAAVANEDTVCYDPSSVLGDTVNVSAAGWPSIASGGSQLTDSFDYCIMDNGAACGTDGTYEVTFQPVIDSVTGIGTGQTTGTVTVTPAGPIEGTVRGVAISKTSYDTYGAPTHAQIAAGVDGNNANVAWGSEFTKSFLSTVSPGWTFGRASSQTYEKSDGTLGTVTSGNPAFTYSGGTAQGVLLEGARTNIQEYSSQIGGTGWASNGGTHTFNYGVAPDGTTTSSRVQGNAGTGWYRALSVTAGTKYTASVYAKRTDSDPAAVSLFVPSAYFGGTGNRNAAYNLDTGTWFVTHADFSAYHVEALQNGWFRIGVTFTPTTTISATMAYYNWVAGGDLQLWGPQFEAGAFPSSYIPTTTGSANRVATSLTRSWNFPSNNFSGQIKVRPQFAYTDNKGTSTQRLFQLDDGTGNNRIIAYVAAGSTDDIVTMHKIVGGSGNVGSTTNNALQYAKGTLLNIRFRADSTGLHFWINDLSKQSITAGVGPTAWTTQPTTVRLGNSTVGEPAFEVVESLTIWNEAKSDAFLEALE